MILFKKTGGINVVIDKTHPLFSLRGMSPVEVLSSELASYLFDYYRTLVENPAHSISNIAWQIVRTYWIDKVEINEDSISKKCRSLLASIKEQLSNVIDESLSERFFNEMSEGQQKYFVNEIMKNKMLLADVSNLKVTGKFMRYVPDEFLLHVFEESPELFFNGNYWNAQFDVKVEGLLSNVLDEMYLQTLSKYKNALDVVVSFMNNKTKSVIDLKFVDAALNILMDDRNNDVI